MQNNGLNPKSVRKNDLIQELVDSCLMMQMKTGSNHFQSSSVCRHRTTIPSSLVEWLEIYEGIVRTTGKVACITRAKEPPSKDSVFPYALERSGYYSLMPNRLCTKLLTAIAKLDPVAYDQEKKVDLEGNEPELRWSPALHLLFESAEERGLDGRWPSNFKIRKDLVRHCDIINGYVNQVREQAHSARFREKQKAFTRGPSENYRWLKSVVEECFRGNECLHFSCLDLGYALSDDTHSKHFYQQVKTDGQALRNNLNDTSVWSETVLGYGLNLRYLPHAGYHYRLLLICQPNSADHSEASTDKIKREWQRISGQDSVMFDLLSGKDQRLKIINRTDDAGRQRLDMHMYFLTHLDKLVRLKLAPKDHTFFKGGKLELNQE